MIIIKTSSFEKISQFFTNPRKTRSINHHVTPAEEAQQIKKDFFNTSSPERLSRILVEYGEKDLSEIFWRWAKNRTSAFVLKIAYELIKKDVEKHLQNQPAIPSA